MIDPNTSTAIWKLRMVVTNITTGQELHAPRENHAPNANEVLAGLVGLNVTRMSLLEIDKLEKNSLKVNRQRSLAAEGLERSLARIAGCTSVFATMPVMDCDGVAFKQETPPVEIGGANFEGNQRVTDEKYPTTLNKVEAAQARNPTGTQRITEQTAPLVGKEGEHTLPRLPTPGRPEPVIPTPREPPDSEGHVVV